MNHADTPDFSVEHRLVALERRSRWLHGWALSATAAALALPLLAALQDPAPDVLRVKGIVVVDDKGRDRILIGAPLPTSVSRVRTDFEKAKGAWGARYPNMEWFKKLAHSTNGIVILNENGHDRIAIGDPTPDPNIGRRIAPASGIAKRRERRCGQRPRGEGPPPAWGLYVSTCSPASRSRRWCARRRRRQRDMEFASACLTKRVLGDW